jgi:hypothetical protein
VSSDHLVEAPKNVNAPRQLKALLVACCGMLLLSRTTARAAESSDGITAVASKTSDDYKRTRLPDGTFKPEYYSFGKGGNWGGEIKDPTIDKLSFLDVAGVIAEPLASQKYLPSRDAGKTTLLIMLYWGTTAVPGPMSDSVAVGEFRAAQDFLERATKMDPASVQDAAMAQMSAATAMLNMENGQRDLTDFRNAAMLGYDSTGVIGTDYGLEVRRTPMKYRRDELISEIEENRYFVVLMAYDFQLLWKQRKHKLLWETRFSIREKDHQFDRDLPAMAQYASQYFGQDTHGLVRKQVPLGHVEIGDLKSLGEVPQNQPTTVPTK